MAHGQDKNLITLESEPDSINSSFCTVRVQDKNLVIKVSDYGGGIEEEHLERLLNVFTGSIRRGP